MSIGWRDRAVRFLARPPFVDIEGRKGAFERFARYQPHAVTSIRYEMPSLPASVRGVFLSDFHVGSHSGDVARLEAIAEEVARLDPEIVLLGGDYMNMMPFGGGRVPPTTIASILASIPARFGRFAVLGNHDREYGSVAVTEALQSRGIVVLADEIQPVDVGGSVIAIAGIHDARHRRPPAVELLRNLKPDTPTIVIAHDPACFAFMTDGPHLMLAGHTHGGQIRLPGIGAVVNASSAPRSWSYGWVRSGARSMYVTSGLGTSALPIRLGIPPEYVVLTLSCGRSRMGHGA